MIVINITLKDILWLIKEKIKKIFRRKTIIILMLLAGLVPMCELEEFESYLLQENDIIVGDIYDYDFENDIPEFETIDEAMLYVAHNMEYTPDSGDYWQTPEETFYRRNENNKMMGDCEDYALLLGYILHFKMKHVVEIIVLKNPKNHIIIYCDNKYIEPTSAFIYDNLLSIKRKYTYSQALWLAVNFHDN